MMSTAEPQCALGNAPDHLEKPQNSSFIKCLKLLVVDTSECSKSNCKLLREELSPFCASTAEPQCAHGNAPDHLDNTKIRASVIAWTLLLVHASYVRKDCRLLTEELSLFCASTAEPQCARGNAPDHLDYTEIRASVIAWTLLLVNASYVRQDCRLQTSDGGSVTFPCINSRTTMHPANTRGSLESTENVSVNNCLDLVACLSFVCSRNLSTI
jgi:hypothetical protein